MSNINAKYQELLKLYKDSQDILEDIYNQVTYLRTVSIDRSNMAWIMDKRETYQKEMALAEAYHNVCKYIEIIRGV